MPALGLEKEVGGLGGGSSVGWGCGGQGRVPGDGLLGDLEEGEEFHK